MARKAAPLTSALVVAMPALALFFAFSSSASSAAYGSESSAHTGANSNSKSTANQNATKLVSFAPSNTELLFAIGSSDKLIGVCSYCDYPDAAKKKTIVGNFIAANLERMAALKPDRVVCVSGQEALAGQLAHNNYKVSIFKNDHISDISKNLKDLAQLVNSTGRGDQAAAAFDKCIADLKATTTKTAVKPSIFYCVWPQPLLTLGKASYLTEAITICGGESISKDLPAGYPHFSLEKLVLANPDIIVMPFECKDHSFLEKHPWSSLKAVKNNRVYFLPDPPHDGLARPTLRLTNGLYWLAKKVHPELSGQLDGWSARTQAALTPFGLPANSAAAKP